MINLVQPLAPPVTMIAPAGGVTSGVPIDIGGICVIPESTEAAGELFAGQVMCVVNLPKAGTAFAVGDVFDWDSSAGQGVATGGTGDFGVGVVLEAAGASATHAKILKHSALSS